jgi:hypothetical protein
LEPIHRRFRAVSFLLRRRRIGENEVILQRLSRCAKFIARCPDSKFVAPRRYNARIAPATCLDGQTGVQFAICFTRRSLAESQSMITAQLGVRHGGGTNHLGSRPAIDQATPNFFSCPVQFCGRALVSEVTVRSAGAEPLAMASTIRDDMKASGMSRRMWRSTLFSRRAISWN